MSIPQKGACIIIFVLAALASVPGVEAQTFRTLYNFTLLELGAESGLIRSSNILYGAAASGSKAGSGAIFEINIDGTGFTNLYSFSPSTGTFPELSTNSDGSLPYGALVLSGQTLFGTAKSSGSLGFGTVYAVNTDGTGFTNLHNFALGDGSQPDGVILASNTLYGTARTGGSSGVGTVFKLNADGSGFTILHSFSVASGSLPFTNSEGDYPQGGLTLSGNSLYGTAASGGIFGAGTVFKVNTDGTEFTNLYNFSGGSGGKSPTGSLILSGSTLYGMAKQGGSSNYGTLFAVCTNGTGFVTLHSFSGGSDGGNPSGGLILSGNTLYGTADTGGSSSNGTVFAVNTDGSGFTNLHCFSGGTGTFSDLTNTDGAIPSAGFSLSGNTLFGVGASGGEAGHGTLFSITMLPPQLGRSQSATNIILTWATYAPGVTLQCSTNLAADSFWSGVSPGPVLVGGLNAVTNALSGPQLFYRLTQ